MNVLEHVVMSCLPLHHRDITESANCFNIYIYIFLYFCIYMFY